MKAKNFAIKGILILGSITVILFFTLTALGIIMTAAGLSCECYKTVTWSLIGTGIISGLVLWIGSCITDKNKNCH